VLNNAGSAQSRVPLRGQQCRDLSPGRASARPDVRRGRTCRPVRSASLGVSGARSGERSTNLVARAQPPPARVHVEPDPLITFLPPPRLPPVYPDRHIDVPAEVPRIDPAVPAERGVEHVRPRRVERELGHARTHARGRAAERERRAAPVWREQTNVRRARGPRRERAGREQGRGVRGREGERGDDTCGPALAGDGRGRGGGCAGGPFSPVFVFLDGVVCRRVPSPGRCRSKSSIASSKPQ
jgi:hypothetical protein